MSAPILALAYETTFNTKENTMYTPVQKESKKVPIHFLVPAVELERIKKVVEALGGIEDTRGKTKSGLTPWRELVASRDGSHSGRVLRGFRMREEMSQADLAEKIGSKQSHISAMESGKSPIGEAVAKKLAKIFMTRPEVFL
jgi:DNA-binding XRE family transcriptional regulator